MTSVKAHLLLDQINAVRGVRGLPPTDELYVLLDGAGRGSPLDAAEQATGLSIDADDATKKYAFQCETADVARKVGDALGQPVDETSFEVPLPRAIDDFVIASAFELVLIGSDGRIPGWVDPADRDASLWELHLMPGIPYPPGHEPALHPSDPRPS
jgi:hypothetical protein